MGNHREHYEIISVRWKVFGPEWFSRDPNGLVYPNTRIQNNPNGAYCPNRLANPNGVHRPNRLATKANMSSGVSVSSGKYVVGGSSSGWSFVD